MKIRAWAMGWLLLGGSAGVAEAAEWFVATNGNDAADGATWATAKQTIQAGIDTAAEGDAVWVSNGVYATGGGRDEVYDPTNRVIINKGIAVRSVNGPVWTVIQGARDPSTTNGLGDAAVRCVYVGRNSNTVLSGFTLRGGATRGTNVIGLSKQGGGGVAGAYPWSPSIVENCILIDNIAQYGGGAISCVLKNCLIVSNEANAGGGAYQCVFYNCGLTANSGQTTGGGAFACTSYNSIVYGNVAPASSNQHACAISWSCTAPAAGGTGNIAENPLFVDAAAGNFRLSPGSPCINAGDTSTVSSAVDLDGNLRIVAGAVDMGAYEYQEDGVFLSVSPAIKNVGCAAAGGLALGVTAAVAWTATTNAPWLAIASGESGTTNGTVLFAVAANVGAGPRTGAVIVAGGGLARTCTVIQTAFVPALAVSPASTNVGNGIATGRVIGVTANVAWTATTNAPWLAIISGESGTTRGTVVFDVATNAGAARTGAVVVAGGGLSRTCRVVQAPGVFVPNNWYVATNGNDAADGATWATAKLTIQAGVDAATNGDVVWVSNGVYATGGRMRDPLFPLFPLTNRVVIGKPITVKSVNGPLATVIRGAKDPSAPNGLGAAAVRCAYMGTVDAVLSGFTLTNGSTSASNNDTSGGGVTGSGTLVNCILSGNSAYSSGGAVYAGGAGSSMKLYNCALIGNSSKSFGGAVDDGILFNCTVVGNHGSCGGGTCGSTHYNCVIYGNTSSAVDPNYSYAGAFENSCTFPDPGGTGNITNDPLFVDAAAGNYRLMSNSLCLDAGDNAVVFGTEDLDSNPRIVNVCVDMGAYENMEAGRDVLVVRPASTNVGSGAAIGLTLEVAANVAWTAITNVPWLTITAGESGTTTGMVTFDVATNAGLTRTGTVIVEGSGLVRTCTVVQAGDPYVLTITPAVTNEGSGAASGRTLAVTANVAWTAAVNVPWLAITSGASGTTNGTVVVDIAANPVGGGARTGAVIVEGSGLVRTCRVEQAENPYVLTISPASMNLACGPASGLELEVTANMAWTATSSVPWLAIMSGEAGTTNGTVFFSVETNASAVRFGEVVATGGGIERTFTVVQAGIPAFDATGYVATNGSDAAAGTNWATAKQTIQAAVDAAADGNVVWVSNGVYAAGGRRAIVGTWSNRVALDHPLTVRSVNGPEVTHIVGEGMRCAYVANGATLSGFTLTNGSTASGCDPYDPEGHTADHNGGGALCADNGVLTNCVLTGNWACYSGGGSSGGVLNNCTLIGNSTWEFGGGSSGGTLNRCVLTENHAHMGGGACGGTLNSCLLIGNSASYGAGADGCTLNNCTVTGNQGCDGGGVLWSTLKNCIVYWNTGDGDFCNHKECTIANSCTTPVPGGSGNIGDDPRLADGNRLQAHSPCINRGSNACVQGTTDLDGNRRIADGTVDMGAFEVQPPVEIQPARTNLFSDAANGLAIDVWASVPWTATTNADWIAITSGESGTTNGAVVFSVASNGAATARTGAVLVAGGGLVRTCAVIQAVAGPFMALGPEQFVLSGDAASGLIFAVTANVAWTATTNVPWLAITTGASGISNGTVTFNVASNGLAQPRAGVIQVSGGGIARTCTVVQAGIPPVLEIDPASTNLPNAAASGLALEVTANVSWAATTSLPWLSITSGASGSTNGMVVFDVDTNVFAIWRTGAVIVAGGGLFRTCVVIQAEGNLMPTNWYVAINGHDAADGTSWATAKRTIQAAVDAAMNGSTVWVSNGTYVGLVTVNKGVKVRSANGAEATTIQGSSSRCVNMSNAAAVVAGFTLTGGTADWGGGAYIDSGALEDCVIRNNTADGRNNLVEQETAYGGGVYGGTLRRCIVAGNLATAYGSQYYRPLAKGGGTYNANLYDCLVVSNEAHSQFGWVAGDVTAGGGVCGGSVWNCTVADNLASLDYLTEAGTLTGGGCYDTALRNSIVYYNMCRYEGMGGWILSNVSGGSATNSCASDIPTGNGNLNDDPLFVDSGSGNYRLATNSPCRDAGNSAFVAGATDLDGNPRIVFGTVDMGAYEFLYQHVAPGGSDGADGISWATAKQTIQAAVDAAKNGCIVLVTNGVYATGGRAVNDSVLTNRVAIDRPIAVRSVNGPEVTIILGPGTNSMERARCAYVGTNAVLTGFTLTNGLPGGSSTNRIGGGAYIAGGMVEQCTISGNYAFWGAGVYIAGDGILSHCRVVGNSVGDTGGGGGVFGSGGGQIDNCLIAGNYAEWAPGVYGRGGGMELVNCTISGNSSFGGPAVAAPTSTLWNCIVYSNNVDTDHPEIEGDPVVLHSCSPGLSGNGNVAADPQFVDAGAGNYRLQATSPCIDAGDDGVVTWAEDLDGNPRIAFGAVDMGAYEAQLSGVGAWFGAITNGQTGDLDCVADDGVPNLLKYATGGSPRISDDKMLVDWTWNGLWPALAFNRNPNATDVRFVVEGTDAISNGAVWRGVATNVGGSWLGAANVAESGTGNPVVCTVTDPVVLGSNRFLRLRISRP